MRLAIRHETQYRYTSASVGAVQRLRLTPSDHAGQRVLSWTLQAPGIESAVTYVDGFGNRTHLVTPAGPFDTMTVVATGELDTSDTNGVLGSLQESAHPLVFLRATALTRSSPAIDGLVDGIVAASPLDRLHLLMDALAGHMCFQAGASDALTPAAEAFAAGKGVCQDFSHVFIAAARRMAIPARYVTGYLHVAGEVPAVAHHAWAEAHVPGLGWVGFDAANRLCPTELYVRLACGFDAIAAAPITGARRGGGAESLTVAVIVQQQQ